MGENVAVKLRDRILAFVDAAQALGASPVECAEGLSSALATLAMRTVDPVACVRGATDCIVKTVEAAVTAEAEAAKPASKTPAAPHEGAK